MLTSTQPSLKPTGWPDGADPPALRTPNTAPPAVGRGGDVVWVSPIKFGEVTKDGPAGSLPAVSSHTALSSLGSLTLSQSFSSLALPPAPTKIFVRSSVYGRITLDGLEPNTTIGKLKEKLNELLKLPPFKAIHLSSWGMPLAEEKCTLRDCKLRTGSQLDFRTSIVIPSEDRVLERVRVVCTALVTRTIPVSKHTTGLELKQRIHQNLNCGEHEWYNKEGARISVTGGTLLATSNVAADAKAETAALRLGDEFVSTIPHLGEMGKGKPVSVINARKGTGPVSVLDTNVVTIASSLTTDKQRLTFRGVDIPDAATLYSLGCRNDDSIMLEFESPVVPPILTLLRTPDTGKASGKKGKGGAKGGGKGGGKGKKKK
jgi:hypothetical protein